jgi:hypothetical protein
MEKAKKALEKGGLADSGEEGPPEATLSERNNKVMLHSQFEDCFMANRV